VRPWWNHYYHFHIRLKCPPGMDGCVNQKPVTGDLGCGKELDNWYETLKKSAIWMARQPPDFKPKKTKKPLRLRDLPKECKSVLTAGGIEPLESDAELPPTALEAVASKEAGPPPPRLTEAQLDTLLNGGKLGMPLPDRNPKR